MKKKAPKKEPNNERWLLTYSDLITLLMIFFVIMYASSNVDAAKYKAVSESFSAVFSGQGKSIVGAEDSESIEEETTDIDSALLESKNIENIKQQVDSYINDSGLKGDASTKIDERGLVISLNNTMFFDTGKDEVKLDSQKQLIEIGEILNKINNYVRIEGHTDNKPIKNEEFESNWQLSCKRAANVTLLLIEQAHISPNRLSAIGYGEFRPIDDNSTEGGRAKNRRVDIVIMNSKFNDIEKNN